MIDLGELPEDHPMRNAPLASIGAEYKHCLKSEWTVIEPHGLGTYTFNEVDGAWLRFNKFRAPNKEPA